MDEEEEVKVDKKEAKRLKKEQEKLAKQERDEKQKELKERAMREKEAQKAEKKAEKERKKQEEKDKKKKAKQGQSTDVAKKEGPTLDIEKAKQEEIERIDRMLREEEMRMKQETAGSEDQQDDEPQHGVKHMSPREVKRLDKERKLEQKRKLMEEQEEKPKRNFGFGFLGKNKDQDSGSIESAVETTFPVEDDDIIRVPVQDEYNADELNGEHQVMEREITPGRFSSIRSTEQLNRDPVVQETRHEEKNPKPKSERKEASPPPQRYEMIRNMNVDIDDEELEDEEDQDRGRSKKRPGPRIPRVHIPSPEQMAVGINNSLRRPLISRARQEDEETLKDRKFVVEHFTPGELASVSGPFDIPMPKFRKARSKSTDKREKEETDSRARSPTPSRLYGTLPKSWREQNIITSMKENLDPKEIEERRELVKVFSPSELAQFESFTDFPVPSGITNMLKRKPKEEEAPKKRRHSTSTKASEEGEKEKSKWLNTRLVTKVKESDGNDPYLKECRELVSTASPSELASITGISDFPVPSTLSNIFQKNRSRSSSVAKEKKRRTSSLRSESVPKSIGETLPRALGERKLLTKIKMSETNEEMLLRKAMVESMSPAELAKISTLSEFPLPSFKKSDKKPKNESETDSTTSPSRSRMNIEDMYNSLPRSLRAECLVKAKVDGNEEKVKERQMLAKTYTPAELSQITSLGEFPIPNALENIFKTSEKPEAPPRKEKNAEKRRRNKTIGSLLHYETLPEALKKECVVRTKEGEDQEELNIRRQLVSTSKPAELGQIHGLSDFPIPTLGRSKRNLKSTKEKELQKKERSKSSSSLPDSISRYGTLPKALTKEILVQSKEVDPEVAKLRRTNIEGRSVSELAQISSISDFPVPSSIQNMFSGSKKRAKSRASSRSASPTPSKSMRESFNATLPRSMRAEVLVRARTEDPEILKGRQELTRAMSPSELAKISSFADFPVPSLSVFQKKAEGPVPPPRRKDSVVSKESTRLYDKFPEALRAECLVRSKADDDEEKLKERQALTRAMSPAELSKIHGFSDFPVPTLKRKKKEMSPSNVSIKSKESQTLYEKLPASLRAEVLVRSKEMTDEQVLKERRELTRAMSPAELGEIRGFSDFPIPTFRKKKEKEMSPKDDTDSVNKEKTSVYEKLPSSLRTEVLVRTKPSQNEDMMKMRERQELTRAMSPSELGRIQGFSDFPIPTLRKRKEEGKLNKDMEHVKSKESLYEKLPQSLRSECIVRSKVEMDNETLKARQLLAQSMSPAELSEIRGISDIPFPTLKRKKEEAKEKSPEPEDENKPKERLYDRLPGSLRAEVLVKSKIQEDEDELKRRRELTRQMSPAELGEIHGFSDFPMPSFRKRKTQSPETVRSKEEEEESESGKEKGKFAALPKSLTAECMVRAKVEDPETQKERAEMVKSMSVHELAQITSFSELPVPSFISRGPRPVERRKKFREKQRSQSAKNLHEQFYDSLPKSMRAEVLVKSKVQDPDVVSERRQVARGQSVRELSQIHSLSDIPVPGTLRNLVSKSSKDIASETSSGRVSRMSEKPFKENIYASLPRSLTNREILLKSRQDDPNVIRERQELAKSMSVSELARISSFGDFPVPSKIERLMRRRSKSREAPSSIENESEAGNKSFKESFYASLPRSMKSEVLVRSRMESQDVLKERKELLKNMTVSEMAKIEGLSDIPIPSPIENIFHSRKKSESDLRSVKSASPRASSPVSEGMYASLPRGLKRELQVRSKVSLNEEEAKRRQALVGSTSPAELGQIHSFSEIPVPRLVEAWLRSTEDNGLASRPSRSAHELRGAGLYEKFPKSFKEPALVKSKVEDPDIQRERAMLTRSKSPSELAEFRSLSDIPLPRLWRDNSIDKSKLISTGADNESTETAPKSNVVVDSLPGTLKKPCIVRSKVENPDILRQRQQLQQSKSVHELSKIGNINEIPLPFKLPLPNIPLPKPTKIFRSLSRRKKAKEPKSEAQAKEEALSSTDHYEEMTPLSDSRTDSEILRYDGSLNGEDGHRQQDFGYEVIDSEEEDTKGELNVTGGIPQHVHQIPDAFRQDFHQQPPKPQEVQAETHFDQYKGTPPMEKKIPVRTKRRHRHEAVKEATPPPPLPPKQSERKEEESIERYEDDEDEELEAVPVKGILTLEATNGNVHVVKNEFQHSPTSNNPFGKALVVEKTSETEEDSDDDCSVDSQILIQSRPLPAPPAPKRSKHPVPNGKDGLSSPKETYSTNHNEGTSSPNVPDLEGTSDSPLSEEGNAEDLLQHVESLKTALDSMSNKQSKVPKK